MEKPFAAYRGELPYIFVCYAHEDSDKVYPEISWLHDQGVNVWYDEGISPGIEWNEALAEAIQGSSRVLFFVTPHSVASENCRRELNFAQEEDHDVVAIHLSDTEVPPGLRLTLNNRQAILKYELSEELYRQELMQVAQGVVGDPAQPAAAPTVAKPSRRRVGLAIVALAAVVAAGSAWRLNTGNEDSSSATTSSGSVKTNKQEPLHNAIAVLPFDNLSPDPDNAYFAAGIHEEVLNQLTKIKDLSVIARTTMVRYADSDMSVPEIGSELRVGTVMEGSVRYAGNRVRITAQVIDATSGVHIWSEAYEEDLEDIFGIQLDIATRIAHTLKAEFSPAERQRVATRSTDNPEAYAHYLRAVSKWGDFAPTGPVHEALDAAISLDPTFAQALAFKARTYAIEATYGPILYGPTFDADAQRHLITLAEDHARRALAIDDGQAFAHAAMGVVYFVNHNWQADFRSADRAYALNPSDDLIVLNAGWRQLLRGNVDEGFRLVQRAVELNPRDTAITYTSAGRFWWAQRWEDAARQASLVVAMAPDAALGYAALAGAIAYTGDADGVRVNARMAEARNPGLLELALVARAYGQIGDLDSARRIFDAVGAGNESVIPDLGFQFWMHMAVREYDAAMSYLERAVVDNFPVGLSATLHFSANHPVFDAIRSHPKFDELVKRAGMPIESAK